MTQRKFSAASDRYPAEASDTAPEPLRVVCKTGNGHTHTDAQIGRDVQRRLVGEPAPRGARLLVSVGDGAVTLTGEVDDQRERERLLRLVRDVPSVREVHDQLIVHDAQRPN